MGGVGGWGGGGVEGGVGNERVGEWEWVEGGRMGEWEGGADE